MPARLGSASSSSGTRRRPYAAGRGREASEAARPACQTAWRLCHSISSALPLPAATRPAWPRTLLRECFGFSHARPSL
eukprot:7087065-Alexandrium_andersonii.AAC.1